ncbi:hypothetical protein [Cyanobium sp. Aljojuca 7D2]|uniref:hypothetical protein n=1 Tax=Cyanobium sp. Aljojuca 7D2 TaxID=2823698 RepID=UPI0039657A9A
MAYPTASHPGPTHLGSQPGSSSRCTQAPRPGLPPSSGEGEHQLEKLEFALAVALTRGDVQRSQSLRDQIAALGGNQEEPGT